MPVPHNAVIILMAVFGVADCCPQVTPFDVFFLLDTSASVKVSSGRWDAMKSFTHDVITRIDIGRNDIHIGVITFGSTAMTDISLTNTYSAAVLNALPVNGGATDTHEAIQEMIDRYDAEAADRNDDPNLVVVVTDGVATQVGATATLANTARTKGIYVFSVGITLPSTSTQLEDIANDPNEFFIQAVTGHSGLSGIVNDLSDKLCAVARMARGGNALGDPCLQNSDCSNITNAACISGTCQCMSATYIYDVTTLGCRVRNVGDVCTTDANCANYTHGTCNGGLCGCPFGYATVAAVNLCQLCVLDVTCDSRANCDTIIPNSGCYGNNLTCDATYFPATPTSCEEHLLTVHACASNDDCDIALSTCSGTSLTCECVTSYKESANLRGCTPVVIGDNCASTASCVHIVPSGICSAATQKCTCTTGYIDRIGTLNCEARVIGGACSSDPDCSAVVGAKCINNKCGCSTGYLTAGLSCRPYTLTVDVCMSDPECYIGVPNSFCLMAPCPANTSCTNQGLCICNPGYRTDLSQNGCPLVLIGRSLCVNNSDCTVGVSDSECHNGICQCRFGYHKEGSLRNCTHLLLGNTCDGSDNCSAVVDRSECNGGKCSCIHGWVKKAADTCKQVMLGEGPCNRTEDCSDVIANSTCSTGGQCQCVTGFEQANRTHCRNVVVIATPEVQGPDIGLIVGLVVGALVLIAGGVGTGVLIYLRKAAILLQGAKANGKYKRLLRVVDQSMPEGLPVEGGEAIGNAPIATRLPAI